MIRMLISDLDGTLLTMENQINQKDIEAINELVREGVDIVIASGRSDHEIVQVFDLLKQNGPRISQNGAFVYDKNGQEVHSERFTSKLATELLDHTYADNCVTTVATETDNYVLAKNQKTTVLEKRMFRPLIESPDLRGQIGVTLHPSKISVHGPNEEIISLQEKINPLFSQDIDTFISDPSCLDIMPKHISKGAAIEQLLKRLNIKPEEIACIGDSFNDLSMFELTPHSFAMSQAHPEVKNASNSVVDHVYEAVEQLISKELVSLYR